MKADFHNHSSYSPDSKNNLDEIKKIAASKNIVFMAVTDHDVMKVDDPFFIRGCEFSTEKGHIIGLFLRKEIKTRKALEVMKEIRKQGGIVYVPHPLRKGSGMSEKDIMQNKDLIDAIEVYNPDNTPYGNKAAYKLAQKLNKCMLTGSDAHTMDAIGKGTSEILVKVRDRDHLKSLIKENKLKIRLDQKYNPENWKSLDYSFLYYGEMLLRKTGLYNLGFVRAVVKPFYRLFKKKVAKQEYR